MEIYNLGFLLTIILVLFISIKFRLNSLSSTTFLINFLFIVVYYLPYFVLHLSLSEEARNNILIGQFFLNIGILLSTLLCRFLQIDKVCITKRETSLLSLPSQGFLRSIFFMGVMGYIYLYITRGIPVLSSNIAIAREIFITGAGPITWPSAIAINFSIWALWLKGKKRNSIIFAVIGSICFLLSGWRGQLIFMILTLIFIMSYKREIKIRTALFSLAAVIAVALFGLLRANISGHALYGLSIAEADQLQAILWLGAIYVLSRLAEHAINYQKAIDYFSIYPLNGEGLIMDASFIFPIEGITIANFMKEKFGSWEGGGGMPVTMLGTFFADFGVVGVMFISFIVIMIHVITIIIFKRFSENNPFYLIPIGFMSTFLVFGFLGSYVKGYISFVIIYSFGIVSFLIAYKIFRELFVSGEK